jgi:hypothetical protein
MTDLKARRIAAFSAPFRVTPGARVVLAKDLDPALKAGRSKKPGVAFPAAESAEADGRGGKNGGSKGGARSGTRSGARSGTRSGSDG